MERFVLDSSQAVQLTYTIMRTRYEGLPPEVIGVGMPRSGARTLSILDAKEPMSIRILALDKDWMHREAHQGAILALETWKVLRDSFDEPSLLGSSA